MKKIAVVIVLSILLLGYFVVNQKKQLSQNVSRKDFIHYGALKNNSKLSPTGSNVSLAETPASTAHEIPLTINQPTDNQVVTSGDITVKGITVPHAEVLINETETKADSQGNFSISLSLDSGENTISVVANDADGNYAEKELTVTVQNE